MTNVKNIFMTNVNTNPHDNTQPDRTTTCDPTTQPSDTTQQVVAALVKAACVATLA